VRDQIDGIEAVILVLPVHLSDRCKSPFHVQAACVGEHYGQVYGNRTTKGMPGNEKISGVNSFLCDKIVIVGFSSGG